MQTDEEVGQTSMAQASESAEANLTKAFREQESNETPPPDGIPTLPEEPQVPPEENSGDYEFDYNGSRHKLSRSEADYLVRFGLDAYQRATSQQAQQGQQAPQAQHPQAQPTNTPPQTDALMSRIDRLEQRLKEADTQSQVRQITEQLNAAVGKVALYSELGKPEHQELFKTLTMVEQYSNQNLSPESAAESAGKKLSALLKDRQSAYVQTKIEQAGKRVESGGAGAATPQGPLGAKDLVNGNVMKSALNRLKQFVR